MLLTIALGPRALGPLPRDLRGELVFYDMDGRRSPRAWRATPQAEPQARAAPYRVALLRPSFASHLAMRGVPLKSIQELMGHPTIQMTMRYAHLAPEIARDAVQLLDWRSPTAMGVAT